MRALVLILLFSFMFLPTYSQTLKDEFTQPVEGEFESWFINEEMINGYKWSSFSLDEKASYLLGFMDGGVYTATHFITDEERRKEVYALLPVLSAQLGFEELVKRIDKFYQDEENKNIPLGYVFIIIRNRLIGVNEDKIQRYIDYLRHPQGTDLREIIKKSNR